MMNHDQPVTSVIKQMVSTTISGSAYGFTAVLVSHPFDTIKTKQQAEVKYYKMGTYQTLSHIFKTEGPLALYRGFTAAVSGSIAFRALPFTAYTFTNTQLTRYAPKFWSEQPFLLAFVAGSSGGFLRSLVECPLEVLKVRRQVGVQWQWGSIYQGLAITAARNMSVVGLFFGFVQASKGWREVNTFLIFF